MRLLVNADAELTADERAACDALWSVAFAPEPGTPPIRLERPMPTVCYRLLDEAGALVALATLTPNRIAVDGAEVAVAGLGGVATDPARRRQGHGARVVAAFAEDAAARGYRWGLLSCRPVLQAFYERAGWRPLLGELTVVQFGRPRPPLGVLMGLALGPDAPARADAWHDARLLLGPGEW